MNSKRKAKEQFYKLDDALMAGLGDNPRPIDEILRIHLLTENVLEKLIAIILGKNAEAVLSSKLSYSQKLSICGKLKFDCGTPVLLSDVKGSLKKLNLLRNDVAHDITHETSDADIEGLFVGQLGKERIGDAMNGSVWDKLSSYKAMIFISLLNPEMLQE